LLRLHIGTLLRFSDLACLGHGLWFATRSVLFGLDRSAVHFDERLRRRLPGGTVLVFADPAGLGIPIFFPLQRAADPFFVGLLLPRSSVQIG